MLHRMPIRYYYLLISIYYTFCYKSPIFSGMYTFTALCITEITSEQLDQINGYGYNKDMFIFWLLGG